MKFSKKIDKQIRERAGNRCEYCLSHQMYVMGKLEIDHIHPQSKGGANSLDNLCLACGLCNQYKWSKTEGFDPVTKQSISLFNPRQQQWSEHFRWSEDGCQIIGLTPIGRATVIALRLNNETAMPVRRSWVSVGWHPPNTDAL